jgi:ABC-type multidrug transport system fused ATPase/permease subunit
MSSTSRLQGVLNRFLSDPTETYTLTDTRHHLVWQVLKLRLTQKLGIALLAILTTLCGLAVPYLQRHFVNGLTTGWSVHLLVWLLLAFLVSFLGQSINFSFRFLATREGLFVQRILSRALYTKTLHLSVVSRGKKTVGETVNYYAQDIPAVSSFVEEYVPNLLTVVFAVCGAPLAVGLFYRLPMTEILTITGLNIAIALFLGTRQARFFGITKADAQARLAVVNEWLQNMRIIRILGWTRRFERVIQQRREKETIDRLAMVTNGSTMNSIAQVTPFLVNVAAVSALVKSHHQTLTPGDIFSMLWVFGVFLARPLRTLPFLIATFTDCVTSARRLEAFFQLEEDSDRDEARYHSNASFETGRGLGINVSNLNLSIAGKRLLSDISFAILPGQFVAIVGEVGSGKTLLLQSLLRSVPATFNRFDLNNSDVLNLKPTLLRQNFGYVSQEGFVMSATLRDNVAFEYNAATGIDGSVEHSLALAQFAVEQENLTSGLQTEIGERGVNLSGGQRQRVNLARCAFFDRPVILLDDCLSAVDIETEAKLNSQLFQGLWRNKTRLMVTHRLSILPLVDRILFMEEGRVVEDGTFAELSAHSNRMKAFIHAHSRREGAAP